MKINLINTLSVNMLNGKEAYLSLMMIDREKALRSIELGQIRSFISNPEIASLIGQMSNTVIDVNKKPYRFINDEYTILAQYSGPKLNPDDLYIPPTGSLNFWRVINMKYCGSSRVNGQDVLLLSEED